MAGTRISHRNYFIDLEHDAQGWRGVANPHAYTGQALLTPAFNYVDRATAEQCAKAAIDEQL